MFRATRAMKDSKKSHIALIGFMGVGKTSVGPIFANLVNKIFIDADTEIEKIAKMPVPRIFEKYGEGHFRRLEHEFYRKILLNGQSASAIIATGGGAVLDGRTGAILREETLVIYLAASSQTIFARIGNDINSSRPLLTGSDKMAEITALMAEREELYRQTCHFVIETDGLDIVACAEKCRQIVFDNDLTSRRG